jgi:hypothetical protein
MASPPTLFRLAEESARIIYGGNIPVAGKVTMGELKIAVAQVCNQLLKVDILTVNEQDGESIPNGTVLGLYENIQVTAWRGKSVCTLPVKPIKLRRNKGIYSVFDSNNPDREFIPLQMGQFAMSRSQPSIISSVLGQCCYENFGMQIVFTKDLSTPLGTPQFMVSMRLAILDATQYGDLDILPILPEMEWPIKKEVVAMFAGEQVTDKVVDPGRKEMKGTPLPQQAQT